MDLKEFWTSPSAWLLGVGVAALLGVWWAKLTPLHGNITLVIGVVAVAISAYLHPWIQSQPIPVRAFWVLGVVSALSLGAYYTLWVDLSQALLKSVAIVSTATQSTGSMINGVPWDDKFTELRISLYNPSKWDYRDINLTILPDVPVIAAESISTVSEVTLLRIGPTQQPIELHKNGQKIRIDLTSIASEYGFLLRAAYLPSGGHLELRMATANMATFDVPITPSPKPDFGVHDDDYVLRVKEAGGKSVWFGHTARPSSIFMRGSPQKVEISGSFEVSGVRVSISENISAVDPVAAALPIIMKENAAK